MLKWPLVLGPLHRRGMSPRRSPSTRGLTWVYFSCSLRRHWSLLRNGHRDFYPEHRIRFTAEAQARRFVRFANKALENGVILLS
jgi:hypothetical protein